MPNSPCLRRLSSHERAEIARVAARMRKTLCEVVGPSGREMYSSKWLIDRVRYHLDADDRAVWLACPKPNAKSIGHLIARIEEAEGTHGPVALISTIYVSVRFRRLGFAAGLLEQVALWADAQKAMTLATNTAHDNHRLISMFERRGFRIVLLDPCNKMVRLERPMTST